MWHISYLNRNLSLSYNVLIRWILATTLLVCFLSNAVNAQEAETKLKPSVLSLTEVCFYSAPNYQGRSFCTTQDRAYIGDGWYENVASISLPVGKEVTVYSFLGFVGNETTYQKSQPNLLASQSKFFSFKVTDVVTTKAQQVKWLNSVLFLLLLGDEKKDTDGDGISDEDEITLGTDPEDADDTPEDSDNDGTPDALDPDRDGDGVENDSDAFPDDATESNDLDEDGIGDNADPDRDGDGVENDSDAFPDDATENSDLDQDGIGDNVDTDRDGDGVVNEDDTFPDDGTESNDLDEDGIGDNADPDRDGDGVEDEDDAFPDDATESSDLDQDGIGDNVDPDRDGDGVANDIEEDQGTNPNDPNDYPDTVAPELQLIDTEAVIIDAIVYNVRGTAIDPEQPNSGVDTILITSEQYVGISFSGTYDAASGEFSIEVPLKLGINQLLIKAIDLSGNTSEKTLQVTRISPPQIVNVTPVSGTIVEQDTAIIRGEIHTAQPLDSLSLRINDSQVTPEPTDQDGVYVFFAPIQSLGFGSNIVQLRLVSPDGSAARDVQLNYVPEGAEDIPAPTISIASPAEGQLLNQDSFRLSAEIVSSAGPLMITLNGQEIVNTSEGLVFYNLNELLSFPDGQDELAVTVEAIDSLDKVTTLNAVFRRDTSLPVIVLNENFTAAPQNNQITQTPLQLSGTVSDNNLSSLLINGQAVSLEPTDDDTTYNFKVSINIDATQTQAINFQAFDRSGNQTQIEYLFENTSTAAINALLPVVGTELMSSGQPLQLQVAARVEGLETNQTVFAYISSDTSSGSAAQAIELSLNGTLAGGSLEVPEASGDYTIHYELRNASAQTLVSAQRDITVTAQSDIPLEIVRIEPENNVQYIEPNAAIEVYFNQPIDLSKLELKVRETLHGKTYINQDELGVDFIEARGYELTDVNYDFKVVTGEIEQLPGGAAIAFRGNQYFGFAADVFIDIIYDGEELLRSTFQVREIPTLIEGSVNDQFNQPLKGIVVDLPELGRSTLTNGDGGFAFGYQEPGDKLIPGGEYKISINQDFKNPRFGTLNRAIVVQQSRSNSLDRYTLQEIDSSVPFYNLTSSTINNLAQGELIVDLSDAKALFDNGRTNGTVHVQFLPLEHIGVTSWQSVIPLWMFSVQPKGIQVEGSPNITMNLPKLRGTYDYIDLDVYTHVVMLGYNSEQKVLEPVGVGRIDGTQVNTVGKLHLQSMDFLGFAQINPNLLPTLRQYEDGEISILELKAALQQ